MKLMAHLPCHLVNFYPTPRIGYCYCYEEDKALGQPWVLQLIGRRPEAEAGLPSQVFRCLNTKPLKGKSQGEGWGYSLGQKKVFCVFFVFVCLLFAF